jgi:hypothetical protein
VDPASPLPSWLLSAFVNCLPYEVGAPAAGALKAGQEGRNLSSVCRQQQAHPLRPCSARVWPAADQCIRNGGPRPQAALRVLDVTFLERSSAPLIR